MSYDENRISDQIDGGSKEQEALRDAIDVLEYEVICRPFGNLELLRAIATVLPYLKNIAK
jgi:hypothetical protein